jgi:LmbE family N-acetylglucosaminyl deacetylase
VDLVRQTAPSIVITHSPDCYAVDHEQTALIVRAACFGAGLRLWETGTPPLETGVPALFYSDAVEDRDKFGRPVVPAFHVDITSVFARRQDALACHASQREWLQQYHGDGDYLASNERAARRRGKACGVRYAEGFRQHLGAAFPQENRLAAALGTYFRPASRNPMDEFPRTVCTPNMHKTRTKRRPAKP